MRREQQQRCVIGGASAQPAEEDIYAAPRLPVHPVRPITVIIKALGANPGTPQSKPTRFRRHINPRLLNLKQMGEEEKCNESGGLSEVADEFHRQPLLKLPAALIFYCRCYCFSFRL